MSAVIDAGRAADSEVHALFAIRRPRGLERDGLAALTADEGADGVVDLVGLGLGVPVVAEAVGVGVLLAGSERGPGDAADFDDFGEIEGVEREVESVDADVGRRRRRVRDR